jgi:acyl-lipid omega-6 desaturase (Delta-12 desaturase)
LKQPEPAPNPSAGGAGSDFSGSDPRSCTLRFQTPLMVRSVGQLVTSFGGFFAVCGVMYVAVPLSVWMALPLSVVAAGFLARIFIIQHDCGHGSFFRSRRLNNVVGCLCSLVTLTPYALWQRQHAGHHGSWNNLDRRAAIGIDIYSSCLTVAKYHRLGRWHQPLYRLTRHPLVSNILAPPLIFMLLYRVPFDTAKGWWRERWAVFLTDIALAVLIGGLGGVVGYDRVAEVQLPIMVITSIAGVWLFSIQHRFEHTLWSSGSAWSFSVAALRGSSHLDLPPMLRWFTGNIGFHHVHHLNPRVPNYRLRECHDGAAILQTAQRLTLGSALRAGRYALWDDDLGHMVRFPAANLGAAKPRNRKSAGR